MNSFFESRSVAARGCSVLPFLVFLVLANTSWLLPGADVDSIDVVSRFVDRHCLECHDDATAKGDLDLLALEFLPGQPANRNRWIEIFDRIEKGEMPPPDKAGDLAGESRASLVKTLGGILRETDRKQIVASGRGSLRRLTRTEYQDNLRDLLQLPNLRVADRLPEDRHAHGFTKVAELLDMSRVQMDGYLDAAEAALRLAVASGVAPPVLENDRFTGTDLFPGLTTFGEREAMFFARDGKMIPISNDGFKKMTPDQRTNPDLELALFRSATWPYYGYPRGFRARQSGEYRVRFSGRAVRQLPGFRLVPALDPLPMSFRSRQPSGPDVSGDVQETGGWMDLLPEAKEFETTILLKAGETFEYSLLGLPVPFIRTDGGFFYDFPPMPPEGHRGAAIQWLEITGPLSPEPWPPASHRVLFGDLPIRQSEKGSSLAIEVVSEHPQADAEKLFRAFADKAARHPVSPEAQKIYLDLIGEKFEQGASFADAMLLGYEAFLCSGHFLYLTEPGKDAPFALASRLSHFLWNSRPDETLLAKAADGSLANPEVLLAEADRLIADPRIERFVKNFTDQWLDLRDLRRDIPDIRLYPEYRKDDYLVDSMERETEAFFTAMIRDNLPATVLVDSEFTYLNDRLAAHYGLPRESGSAMRKVELPDWSPYGGLLTQASVLKLTSNGTTTSPVLRGVWVMEKLMGDRPPPPPKSVPAIEPDIRGATTIRDLLAKHTESGSCLACHARFDPVGFALENFDIMGAWRDRYRGLEKGEKITGYDPAGHPFEYRIGPEVEPSGKLRNGETFENVHELKHLLAANPRPLGRNLLHQLTLYSTGTSVRFSERPQIEAMLDRCEPGGYRVGDLIRELITSDLFTGLIESDPRG
ncbi:MAG: DUF1592 domain-containing protein [Verrucomicrobiales bacterium]|nr:DUF1592 domain-containing protein [Verrucomicrobiales bacterium]